MTQAQVASPAVSAYERKLTQLSIDLSAVREQLEHELLGLLSPQDLIALWKLRGLLSKTRTLLDKSRTQGQGASMVSNDMLEMVIQIERIIAHAQGQVECLRSQMSQ